MQFPPTVDPGPAGPADSALLRAVLCELVLVGYELYVGVAAEAVAPTELGALVLDGELAVTGGALAECAIATCFTADEPGLRELAGRGRRRARGLTSAW